MTNIPRLQDSVTESVIDPKELLTDWINKCRNFCVVDSECEEDYESDPYEDAAKAAAARFQEYLIKAGAFIWNGITIRIIEPRLLNVGTNAMISGSCFQQEGYTGEPQYFELSLYDNPELISFVQAPTANPTKVSSVRKRLSGKVSAATRE